MDPFYIAGTIYNRMHLSPTHTHSQMRIQLQQMQFLKVCADLAALFWKTQDAAAKCRVILINPVIGEEFALQPFIIRSDLQITLIIVALLRKLRKGRRREIQLRRTLCRILPAFR